MAKKTRSNQGKNIPMARTVGNRTSRPATRAKTKKKSRTSRRTVTKEWENETIISGRDLVIPTPQNLPTGASEIGIFQIVPANPAWWEGTRIQKIAQSYQLYRPLKFKVHYHPQVPVTNAGLVVYGTMYQDQATTRTAIQQVLNTSNGGGVCECYSPFTSTVDVNDKFFQMKNFNVVGSASDTTCCPFVWLANYSGYAPGITSSSTPGWVEVEWTYRFVNGLPGPGNSSSGQFVASEQELSRYRRIMARSGLRAFDWSAPFGVPLGVLKAAATPLLRHVSVILLKEAQSGSLRFGIGKALNWIADSFSRRDGTTSLADDAGNSIELPDDTPVVILQSGLPQAIGSDEDERTLVDRVRIFAESVSILVGGQQGYTGSMSFTLTPDNPQEVSGNLSAIADFSNPDAVTVRARTVGTFNPIQTPVMIYINDLEVLQSVMIPTPTGFDFVLDLSTIGYINPVVGV